MPKHQQLVLKHTFLDKQEYAIQLTPEEIVHCANNVFEDSAPSVGDGLGDLGNMMASWVGRLIRYPQDRYWSCALLETDLHIVGIHHALDLNHSVYWERKEFFGAVRQVFLRVRSITPPSPSTMEEAIASAINKIRILTNRDLRSSL